jgi:hypothetical protein
VKLQTEEWTKLVEAEEESASGETVQAGLQGRAVSEAVGEARSDLREGDQGVDQEAGGSATEAAYGTDEAVMKYRLKISCESGHEDLLQIEREGPGTVASHAGIMITLLEWQANKAPAAVGCDICGGHVTVEGVDLPDGEN